MAPEQAGPALRGALECLAASQPPSPPGRYAGIRERVRRRRRQQAAVSATAVVALAATATTLWLGGPAHRTVPPARPGPARAVPAWALPWPDHRDGSVPPAVQASAVLSWRVQRSTTAGPLPAPRRVIWYLAERLRGSLAVVFEVSTQGRNWLVTGTVPARQVPPGRAAAGHASGPGWVFATAAAPAPQAGLVIGLYLPQGRDGPSSADAFVLLTDPATRSVGWRADTATGRLTGRTTVSDGLALAVPGTLRGPVRLTVLHTGRVPVTPHPSFVGVPGAAGS